MKDMISRNDAYNTLTEYYHHTTEIQHKALREALERVPDSQPELIEREAYIRGFEQGKTQGRLDTLSAQPERLTDDDFETIRIHLNAYKEKLCNQHRWEEADEYQRIIDRFMAFASAQPVAKDINVPVKDCISRKEAIDAFYKHPNIDWTTLDVLAKINALPPAQHDLSEYSDKLWKAAYERGKAEALDEIVRCKDCRHQVKEWRTDKRLKDKGYMVCGCEVVGDACGYWALLGQNDDYCSMAERRLDVDANT